MVGAQASAATLTNATWSVSKTTDGATSTAYTYTFNAATSASLVSITMTVPTGTAGTPSVGTVSPTSIAGGSVALAGTTLTYTFTSALIAPGQAVSVQINGLTNTTTAGSYTAQITTHSSAGAVDTGTTASVTFTATALTSPTWSASSTTVGATGTSYTYTFTTASLGLVTSITMTVPPGTAGTPTVGTVTPAALAGGTVTLSGTTLTYSGISVTLLPGTAVSIPINGLTNTATAGRYTSEIVTNIGGLVALDSGVTATVTFTGPLTVTGPGSLTWAITLNGTNQNIADAVAGDQQLTVSDQTLSGAGWHITISATTFTNGTHTLSNTGTFVLTGSVGSITASSAPSSACTTSCTPPGTAATYPVAITTAASSPTPVIVYDASAGSGLGAILLGGATGPVGWWVEVPANARNGTYTSTVTVAIVSGP